MTLTLPSEHRKRPPLPNRDWKWDQEKLVVPAMKEDEIVEIFKQPAALIECFERNPPMPDPVKYKPVDRTQEDADLDYLCKPIHLEVDTPWDRSVGKLKHEVRMWHERFLLVLTALAFLAVFAGWGGWNQMQRIRAYRAASEGRAQVWVEEIPSATGHADAAESFSKNGSGETATTAPAPQGGQR